MKKLENIILSNPKRLKGVLKKISLGGAEKLHVVSDFDRTLTYAFVKGKKIPSVISILRDDNYLTEEYSMKAQKLYEKYHPIEINPALSIEEKKKAMMKWWSEHFKILIRFKLNKKDVERAVLSGKVKLRDGALEFLDYLHLNRIPLVVFSSAGLGEESISLFLKKEKRLYKNIHIVSNRFDWDEKGFITGVEKPIIHIFNKDETSLKKFNFYKEIKDRKNVILLGDSLGDIGMVKGFDYDNLIKIGFLNEEIRDNLEQYRTNYDIIILNDSDMRYVNGFMREILTN